jgi:hypothetical protein
MLRRLFGLDDNSAGKAPCSAKRQAVLEDLSVLAATAAGNAEYYAALSDYVTRFKAIKDEVAARVRGSDWNEPSERHRETERVIYLKGKESATYEAACNALEKITERLWELNKEEFTPIAEKRDVAPGPFIWGNICDTLVTAKQAIDG